VTLTNNEKKTASLTGSMQKKGRVKIQDLVLVEQGTEVMTHCTPEVVAWIMDKARHIK
jgi:translation initiation factor IF-1